MTILLTFLQYWNGETNMTARKLLPIDPDLVGVENALRRAAKSALKLARQTKTPCYVVKDGLLVNIAERPKKMAKQEKRVPGTKS